jgi:uncharacterized protein
MLVVTAVGGTFQGLAGARTPYPGGIFQPGPAKYGVSAITTNVPITMDDGVILRADVAYPTDLVTGQPAPGPFPVIIQHDPYSIVKIDTYYTQYGYITARVHARGTGDGTTDNSGGDVQFFTARDGQDGADVVKWATTLAHANGQVGQVGCSYLGGLALDDASHVGQHSPLKATVAECAGLDNITHEAFLIGGFGTQTLNLLSAFGPLVGRNPYTSLFFDQLVLNFDMGGADAYVGEFWQQRNPLAWAQNIVNNGIPVLFWAGWDGDLAEAASLQTYAALQNAYRKRSVYAPMLPKQPATPRYQVIIGNWGHGGGLDDGIVLEWFETWIKGVKTGIENTSTPLHLYEAGSDRWINAAQFPTVPKYTTLYLNGGGALTSSAPTLSASDTIMWEQPNANVPNTVLDYTTPPLPLGATLAGPISVTIYASSSNTNLELIPALYDIAPDGTATAIGSRGAVLGSQRALDQSRSWKDQSGKLIRPWASQVEDFYLTAGQVYRLDIMLYPRQYGLSPNHQLELELTTQNATETCTKELGEDACFWTDPQLQTLPGGTYSILHGPEWPSVVLCQEDAKASRRMRDEGGPFGAAV